MSSQVLLSEIWLNIFTFLQLRSYSRYIRVNKWWNEKIREIFSNLEFMVYQDSCHSTMLSLTPKLKSFAGCIRGKELPPNIALKSIDVDIDPKDILYFNIEGLLLASKSKLGQFIYSLGYLMVDKQGTFKVRCRYQDEFFFFYYKNRTIETNLEYFSDNLLELLYKLSYDKFIFHNTKTCDLEDIAEVVNEDAEIEINMSSQSNSIISLNADEFFFVQKKVTINVPRGLYKIYHGRGNLLSFDNTYILENKIYNLTGKNEFIYSYSTIRWV